jgi:hypothetical protein
MKESFIQKLAEARASEIFTKDYFQHATDSWYFDELNEFKSKKYGIEGRKPTKQELEWYGDAISDLFDEYKEKFYANELAQDCYGKCIDNFSKIFKYIEYGNKYYSQFDIDEETIKKLKDIANIFVTKHNEFCK